MPESMQKHLDTAMAAAFSVFKHNLDLRAVAHMRCKAGGPAGQKMLHKAQLIRCFGAGVYGTCKHEASAAEVLKAASRRWTASVCTLQGSRI
jgi:hypothetical protein